MGSRFLLQTGENRDQYKPFWSGSPARKYKFFPARRYVSSSFNPVSLQERVMVAGSDYDA
jgi:hypothetical protein